MSRRWEQGRLSRGVLLLILASGSAQLAWNAWTARTAADWATSLCWTLASAVLVESIGGPALLPWWVRRVLEAAWLAGAAAAVRLPGKPAGTVSATLVLGAVLAVGAVAVTVWARAGQWGTPVSVPLTFPLRGRWYVAQGGASKLINHHVRVPEQRAAIDLVRTGPWGTRRRVGRDCEAYLAYGQPVYSPCAGTVVAARGDLPDQVPGRIAPQPAGGNEVVIDTGRERVLLAHLRPGSVRVAAGQLVSQGDLLGEVGNSGNTTEPHLHLQAHRDGLGLDLVFTGKTGRYWRGRTLRG